MKQALNEAQNAKNIDEVPIGAIVVYRAKIIGRGFNQSIKLNDPTAHAEILAIRDAAKFLNNYRLNDCILYSTIEPCPMCVGACVWARIDTIVYGSTDEKVGSCGTVFDFVRSNNLNHKIKIIPNILEKECKQIIQNFFRIRR